MKDACKYILVALLLSFSASAQNLPALKQSQAIKTGSLNNGTVYYIVANPSFKGYADFALVQKNHIDNAESRRLISSFGNFSDEKPYRSLASKGVRYTRRGFISSDGSSTIFSFRDVPVFDQSAADSTLLTMVYIMRECPVEQAVVISGDVNAVSVIDRLGVLSLTVPRLKPSPKAPGWVWNPDAVPELSVSPAKSGRVASVNVSFPSPRTPDDRMGTTQPFVTSMLASELESIVRRRIRIAFREAGIPLGNVRASYRSSADGPGDELHSFSIVTDSSRLADATALLASVLGALDANGAMPDEVGFAKERLLLRSERENLTSVTNAEYVKRCVSAYLYGAPLAEETAFNDFISGKAIPVDVETSLFNKYAAAVLSPSAVLKLNFSAPDGTSVERLAEVFDSSWKTAAADSTSGRFHFAAADTASFFRPKGHSGAKLKTSTVDSVTGGQLLLFSNGVKVVTKTLPTKGQFRYSLVIRGGVNLVPGLKDGESAFVGDMLQLCSVAGMSADAFRAVLRDNGITMSCRVSASNMEILGSAPSDRLPLLLSSLLSLSLDRSPDKEAFGYYRGCERLRIESRRRSDAVFFPYLDSLRRPDYCFRTLKSGDALSDDLPAKADRYFTSQLSRINDGVLILAGDLPSAFIQKQLPRYVGCFRTSRSYAARPKLRTAYREGWFSSTRSASEIGSGDAGTGVIMSAQMPFTMQNYMTFKIACASLERAVTEAMAPFGMTAELRGDAEFYPTEQFSVSVFCYPVTQSGLPSDVGPCSPRDVQNALRKAVVTASSSPLPVAVLRGYKEELISRNASLRQNPVAIVEAASIRYSLGRDMITGYDNYIKSVTSDGVCAMLKALDNGSKMELTVR